MRPFKEILTQTEQALQQTSGDYARMTTARNQCYAEIHDIFNRGKDITISAGGVSALRD